MLKFLADPGDASPFLAGPRLQSWSVLWMHWWFQQGAGRCQIFTPMQGWLCSSWFILFLGHDKLPSKRPFPQSTGSGMAVVVQPVHPPVWQIVASTAKPEGSGVQTLHIYETATGILRQLLKHEGRFWRHEPAATAPIP